MKRLACLVLLCLLLGGCGAQTQASGTDTLRVAAATWPVYCFASAVTQGVDGVETAALMNGSISCLHDYTLTTAHMRELEQADVIALNGVGLEDFMSDALSGLDAVQIDCSAGIPLLPSDHGGDDPHIWMDPGRAAQMLQTFSTALQEIDPEHAQAYQENTAQALERLAGCLSEGRERLADLPCRDLITFHEGFRYFAEAFDLEILCAIEEEEGSTASAQDISRIVDLIAQHSLPAIFTETYGPDATARTIQRETDVGVCPLSMIMSGEGSGLEPYLDAMEQNYDTLTRALGGNP